MEVKTQKLGLTPADKRQIWEAHEQTVREEAQREILTRITQYIQQRLLLAEAAHDLSDVLLVICTLAMSNNWLRLQDERFIREIGAAHRNIREISKTLDDPDILEWNRRLQSLVDSYVLGLFHFIRDGDESSLRELASSFTPQALRLPPYQFALKG